MMEAGRQYYSRDSRPVSDSNWKKKKKVVRRGKRKGLKPVSTETRNVVHGTLDQTLELLRRRIPQTMTVLVNRPNDPEVSLESFMKRVSWEVGLKAVGASIKLTRFTKPEGYLMEAPCRRTPRFFQVRWPRSPGTRRECLGQLSPFRCSSLKRQMGLTRRTSRQGSQPEAIRGTGRDRR